jgi:cytochrome c oxidase subunit 2
VPHARWNAAHRSELGEHLGHDARTGDNRIVHVDAAYIRRSIREPQADVVAGYPPTMPSFAGYIRDDEIDALAAPIESLK